MNIIYNLILYVAIYSFFGWVCETIYCALIKKKFVNRGFLNGPFCPIYGFGAVILIISLYDIKENIPLLFVLSVLLTSILEYITSYIMEKIFHAKWWDYSDKKFNIQGRVCLENSLLFGIMSVFFMVFIHSFISGIIHSLPIALLKLLSISLLIYFTIDLTVSVITAMKIKITLDQIKNAPQMIKEKFDSYNPSKKFRLRKKSRQLFYKRIINAFPNIKYNNHHESLTKLKELLIKPKH